MEQDTSNTPPPSGPRNNGPMIAIIVVVILLILGIAYAATRNSANNSQTAVTPSPTPTDVMQASPTPSDTMSPTPSDVMMSPGASPTGTKTSPTPTTQAGVKTFTVVGANYSFAPSEIKVNKGDKVKIVFQNSEGFHDFVIDEFNVKTDTIPSGKTATIEFTADKAGTFEYYCSVDSHRAMGMKGSLVVN